MQKEFFKRSERYRYNYLLETIQSLLSKAVIISICADIWSKQGMTSFLDVTAHFFTPDSNKRHSICIALRFPSPHTSVRKAELLQRIVAE